MALRILGQSTGAHVDRDLRCRHRQNMHERIVYLAWARFWSLRPRMRAWWSRTSRWRPKSSDALPWHQKRSRWYCSTLEECQILTASKQCFEFCSRRCKRSRRGQDRQYHPRIERASPKALLRKPKARKVCEKEVEFEQEQSTTFWKWSSRLKKTNLWRTLYKMPRECEERVHAGLRHSQKMADIRKPRGLPGNVADTEDQFWRKREQWCSR